MISSSALQNFTIEEASTSDIQGIMAVLEENLLVNKDESEVSSLQQTGFLIVRYSPDDLRRWIEDKKNHIVLVCKEAGQVIGYTVGCDLTVLPPEIYNKFEKCEALKSSLTTHPIMYHKQIAVKAGRNGVGSPLIKRFFDTAVSKKYDYAVCLIVHEPICNKASADFHKKHGFKCVDVSQVGDTRNGIYIKSFTFRG